MTTEPKDLAVRLRLHAYELLNGGANASDLVKDLRTAADHLTAHDSQQPAAAPLPASAALPDLIEQWREKRDKSKAASREANHEGKVELDAYRDGKAMAYDECIYELERWMLQAALSRADQP